MSHVKGKLYKVKADHRFHANKVGRFQFYGGPQADVCVLSLPRDDHKFFAVGLNDLVECEEKHPPCFTEEVKNVAAQIGEFYLDKNGGDYEKTCKEVTSLRIHEISFDGNTVNIVTYRPGLLIGKRGENIDKLIKWLERPTKIVEATDDLLCYLVPQVLDDEPYWSLEGE